MLNDSYKTPILPNHKKIMFYSRMERIQARKPAKIMIMITIKILYRALVLYITKLLPSLHLSKDMPKSLLLLKQ